MFVSSGHKGLRTHHLRWLEDLERMDVKNFKKRVYEKEVVASTRRERPKKTRQEIVKHL